MFHYYTSGTIEWNCETLSIYFDWYKKENGLQITLTIICQSTVRPSSPLKRGAIVNIE
jgi:hypothetical protein